MYPAAPVNSAAHTREMIEIGSIEVPRHQPGGRKLDSQRLPKHVGSTPWLGRTRETGAGATDLLLYFRRGQHGAGPLKIPVVATSVSILDRECRSRMMCHAGLTSALLDNRNLHFTDIVFSRSGLAVDIRASWQGSVSDKWHVVTG